MDKIAFVFSGQGDQFPGMGKDLYDNYPVAREVFDLCDEIRPGTSSQCFEGTEEELKETRNTQPCLFAMELAAAAVMNEKGITPVAVAGFSLGELVAATVSGTFDEATGFRLVCKRAELMQHEAEKYDTFMAAVVKLTPEKVKEVCSKHSEVYPVNFNGPGQTTVAGLKTQMADFVKDVKAAGGRAIPLRVGGAFHSPFMQGASEAFAEEAAKAEVKERTITLYSNMTAEPYGEDVAGLLSGQICNPVLWEKIVRNMIAEGISTFVEIGPGKTLTNMIRKIDSGVEAVSYAEYLAEVE